jgi:hypothetical protein
MEEQNVGKKSVKIIPRHDTHKGIDSQKKIRNYREQTHSNESLKIFPKQAGIRKEKQAFVRYLSSHIFNILASKQRNTMVIYE